MKKNFKIISFDADDTLWVNEPFYLETENRFCSLLSNFADKETISKELFKTEMQNLKLYGYGGKGFMLSMIETAIRITDNQVPENTISQIIELGKGLLDYSIELLDGVKEVLRFLGNKGYKLIVATKGDLLDQERKLEKSGLEKYFHHIEIMSNKQEEDYLKLISHLDIEPEDFLMIGNSLKSDVIPILNIGGSAMHIPFHTTWKHEQIEKIEQKDNFMELENIRKVKEFFTDENN